MLKVVKLQSCEGEIVEIEPDIVDMCATIKNMLKGKTAFKNSLGGQFTIEGNYVILKKEGRILANLIKNTPNEAIFSLPDVKYSILSKVLEYCKYHVNATRSERETKLWDSEFVQVKQSLLCDLASASYYLDIKPLVNLTSRAIATQISGKTSEEIRETFCNLNYEIYAPVFASSMATRCRLQRKINQKKLTTEGNSENNSNTASTTNTNQQLISNAPSIDERSLDELLDFINTPNSVNSIPTNNSNSDNDNETSISLDSSTENLQQTTSKKKKKKKKNKGNNNNNNSCSSNDNSNNLTPTLSLSNRSSPNLEVQEANKLHPTLNHKLTLLATNEPPITLLTLPPSTDVHDNSNNNNNTSEPQPPSTNKKRNKNTQQALSIRTSHSTPSLNIPSENSHDPVLSGLESPRTMMVMINVAKAEENDLDPQLQEALDKEVEDFRQRLESVNTQTRSGPKLTLPPATKSSFASSLVGVH